MSTKPTRTEILVDWTLAHFHRIVLVLMALALGVLIVVTWQVNQRLGAVEQSITERLRYRPPVEAENDVISEFHEVGERRRFYVPAHSHVYGGEGDPLLLTVTCTVRNTDPAVGIHLYSVRYHDTAGKLLKEFVPRVIALRPLETVEYLVGESDVSGGSGANFIVEWSGVESVNTPIVEAVMIGTSGGRGISFVQRGSEITAPAVTTTRSE